MGIDSMVHRIVGSRNGGNNTFTANTSKSLYEGVRAPKRANKLNESGGSMRYRTRRPLRRRGLYEDVDAGVAPAADVATVGTNGEAPVTPVFNITCTNPECGYTGPVNAFVDQATGDLVCPQCGAIFDIPVPTGTGDVDGIEAEGTTPAITEARIRRLRRRLSEARRRMAARRGRRLYEEDEYVDDVDAGAYEVPAADIVAEDAPVSSAQVICGTCGYTANSTDYEVSVESFVDADGIEVKEAYLICPSCAAKNQAGIVSDVAADVAADDYVEDVPADDFVADEVVESRKLTPFKRVILRTLKENRAPRSVVKALYEGRMGVVNKFIKNFKKVRR